MYKNIRRITALLLIALILPLQQIQAQAPAKFELTIDNIMRGAEMIGTQPSQIRWSMDSQRIYFNWKQPGEPADKDPDLYTVNRDGSGLRKLAEEEAEKAPPSGGELSKDKNRSVYADNGDIFIYDHTRNDRKQLTKTVEVESDPHFTFNQRSVYFMRANNLYAVTLDDGSIEQLTDLRMPGGPPAQGAAANRGPQTARRNPLQNEEKRGTASQEYLKKEERELIETVKQRSLRREERETKKKDREKRQPFQLQSRQSIRSLLLSPDGKYVIAGITENPDGAKTAIVPNFVTETAYTEDIMTRTKVGDPQPRLQIAVINGETGEMAWVDHGQKEQPPQNEVKIAQETNSTEKRAAGPNEQSRSDEQGGKRENEPRERDVALFNPIWSEDGTKAVLQARSEDNKDRWILLLDPATGKTKVLANMHDDAWIGGPGSFTLGWMPDNKRVYFMSERDGFAHLYTASIDGGEPVQLTQGKFEIFQPTLSEDKTKWHFTSSEVHPGERHFYSMPVEGGARTKITSMPGNHQTSLSPDESMLAAVYSYSNKPPELYLMENKPGAEAKRVTTSPAAEWLAYNWIDPPLVTIKARDGAEVYARIYKPEKFPKGGPAVIFVHGAGYLQNAHKYWSSYFREYMFHHFLMQRGYLVLDIDYRGSAGYGRDWRVGIYRYMGGKDLDDHIDAARWLASEHGVDSKRIGIYGGSYGGFITLMAMFTQPDVFAAGAALRPVTDWAHYNHPYTSNILNTPQKDPEAYKRSSPIYFADGLKGALLMCHGMADVNVHFQDTVRLAQRLIELRKENWELAAYPVEDHGFIENTSWADEYKRIFKLFENNLKSKETVTKDTKTKKR